MPPAPTLQELIDTVRGDAATDAPLGLLGVAAATVAQLEDVGDALLSHFVDRCRRAGYSWSEISAALGVSKQAAHKRFSPTTPMLERFTPRARRILEHAEAAARGLGHDFVGTEHMLLALFDEPDAIAARVLSDVGVSRTDALREVLARVAAGTAAPAATIPLTPRAGAVIAAAVSQALDLGHNYVGTEHLLLALYKDQKGVGAAALAALGVRYEDVRVRVIEMLSAFRRQP